MIVIGKTGQVARALAERASAHGITVTPLGRPQLDLADPSGIQNILMAIGGDLIVNTAAYTAVDQAEAEPDLVNAINGIGAGVIAAVAASMNVPIIHLSTDYVFDGTANRPYREDDEPRPLGVYGSSKLLGEQAVAAEAVEHVILRTSWIYSPFGRNFIKTMLRLARERCEIGVVADQYGSPTSAFDIADGIIVVGRNLLAERGNTQLRGIFHMTGSGTTTWAEFGAEIFRQSGRYGGPIARVRPIPTAAYPTPAKRPANSRLDCTKIAETHRVGLPDWHISLEPCVLRLINETKAQETHQ